MTRHVTFLTASIAAGTLVLASCGSPDEDTEPAATSASPSPTVDESSPAETETPEPSPEDTATEEEGESPEAGEEEPSETDDESTSAEETPEESPGTGESQEEESAGQADFSEFSQEVSATEDFPHTSGGWEEAQHLVEVRVGQHEGYDRVVFEHSGPSELAYQVEYVDRPTDQGLGEPIDVPGDTFISVSVSGIGFNSSHHDRDAVLSGPVEEAQSQSRFIQGVHAQGPFEGQSQYFVGLDQQRDFRVQMDEDPKRIVLDLAH